VKLIPQQTCLAVGRLIFNGALILEFPELRVPSLLKSLLPKANKFPSII